MKKGTWKQKSIKKCVAWLLAFALVLPMPLEVFADTETETATELETLDPTLENITFGDFPAVTTGHTGVYGRYEANKRAWVLMAANNTMGTLSGKVLNGNVIFGSHPFQLQFGGDVWGANGYSFRFYRDWSHGEGELGFDFGGKTGIVLTSEIAQTDLVDSEFNLKLSFEEEDTDGDGANELKLGVWFNNVLYNNTYFYAEGTYDTYLNPTICSYGVDTAGTSSAYFVLKPSREQTLDPALTWFTFSNCGIENKTYTGSGFQVSVNYNPGTGWDNAFSGKVLNGNVTFTSAPFCLKLGMGSDNGIWSNDMICLYRDSNTAEGALKLNVGNTSSYTLTPEAAGTALIGQELNLKVSFQEIDSDGDGAKDQLKVGIWFNNYLYGDEYFYVTGEYLHCTYGWLGFHGDSADASITLSSCKNTLDPSLKQFTFSDFNGGADGTYSASTGWSLLKEYFGGGAKATAFSGKVLNGYVTFGTGPSELRFGGDMWSSTAFRFYRDSSSQSDELYFYFNGTPYTLTSDIAGTDLVGERFNLKISFQEIDNDGDGTKDRLKVGLWFEDVLYNETYFYVDADYSKFITGVIYVYGPNCGDGGYVKLTSCKEKEGSYITETNTGDMNRVPYNNDEISADLEVGVASYPVVVDKNGDGYMDLMVGGNGTADVGHGTYIFYGSAESQDKTSENYLLMDKGRQIAEHGNTFYGSYLYDAFGNYDKTMLIGAYDPNENSGEGGNTWAVLDAADYPNTFTKLTGRPGVGIPQEILDMGFTGAFNPWTMFMADYDGDGDLDWITGWGNWEDYSTSGENVSGSKYTSEGLWDGDGDGEEDLVHGWVMWNENLDETQGASGVGAATYDTTNTRGNLVYVYDYEETGGVKSKKEDTKEPLDVYGCTDPQFRDFDKDGDLDIVCCSFIGELIYFENIAKQGEETPYDEPTYIKGRSLVEADGSNAELELAMPVMTAFDWNNDGYMDLICGEEDGRVCLVEHTGTYDANGTPIMEDIQFFQTPADSLKDGALNTPYSVDWDGDGDEDIISGNSAGFISFTENLTINDGVLQGDLEDPIWANPIRMQNEDGTTYRIMAGKTGSIQGPNEAKWGYTILSVADWDGDGVLDIMSNNITGQVFWHKGIKGQKTIIGNPQPVEVEWTDGNKYPEWNWWAPEGKELVVQWRTTPYMIDLPLDEDGDGVATGDGLMDLVTMDYQGYMSFFQRYCDTDGTLKLKEGQRIFKLSSGAEMYFRDYTSAEYGREGKSGKIAYALSDFDCDGDIDILRNGDKNIAFYENISETPGGYEFNATPVDVHERILVDHTPTPAVCDWNGDNVPDLLVGTMDGHFYYMTNDVTNPIASVEVNAEITDSIAMNYSVTLAEGVTEAPTMTFAMASGETLKNIQGEQVGTSNTYTFTYPGVMAQNMANTITAKVTVGEYTDEYNYSILDYCGKLLTTEEYSAYRDLVVNLVQYGEAVQAYRVSKDMESAPAETLTEQLYKLVPTYASYDEQVATTLEGVTDPVGSKLSGTADTYLWKNVTLVLGNKVKIRARFTATGIDGLTIKATIGGKEQTLIPTLESEGVYRVDFDKIYANEYAEPIAITFYQEDQAIGQTLNYSVNSYLSSSSSTADTYLSNLLVAINNFGNAAVAYKQDSVSAAQ